MTRRGRRFSVTLPPEYAAKLARLAEQAHVRQGTLARSLLAQALDEADLDARHVVEILDGIPGAWERVERGVEQARADRTIPLADL